jgi:hypothetical protein
LKRFLEKHHRIIFYAGWLLLGLLQSIFTELQDDEAYYWVFSKYLDWGYFDHPPMTALLIRIGTTFLSGEVAVRIVPLLLNTATIFIIEKLTERKDTYLFYAIALSVAVLQISGFVAVPDVPLMFFTALFFLVYKSYLQTPSWRNALLIALTAAALLYSKYHGVLLLFFVLISNPKLLRNIKIYVAGLAALVLFLPHLYWQYQHNWISFRYHLFESNVNPYKVSYTTDYILGQLLLAGPIAGFILWPATFLYRTKNYFEKALKFTAIGFVLFFLLSTLKGKVEPNWTSPAIIAVMVLAHHYLVQKRAWRRWLIRLLPITILLVICFRIVMIWDIIPARAIVERYHGWAVWPQALKQKTGNLPIVFNNSYQRASKYWFYSGQITYSLNNYDDRRNNYNFWPVEDSLLGRPVYIMDIYGIERFKDSVQTPLFNVGYGYDSSFHSFGRVTFKSDDYVIRANDSLTLHFAVEVPPYYRNYLLAHPEIDEDVVAGIFNGRDVAKEMKLPLRLQAIIQKDARSFVLYPGIAKGDYVLRFGVFSDSGFFSHNSDKIKLKVEAPIP